jgi:DNA polymerase-3 subunit epsilon
MVGMPTASEIRVRPPVPPPLPPPIQRSFDDLGTPLIDVTFCVIDIETTGGSAADGGITELGAVKLRGGACLGTFQTMVNPGHCIPPAITMLTGITEAMVMPAPRIESVLPTLLEFIGDAVVVGHNVRYDLGFIGVALERAGQPKLTNRTIDTYALAKRLVRDEVPNCKLGTLASRLRLDHQPSHRALDDALATGDLLHVLLERAAGLGVTGLDDLLLLPKIAGHEQASKLKLTAALPRAPGVYFFRDRSGTVLYVGKATDLRARVRSYFSSDERRKITQLLRETSAIDHQVCTSPLEAAVREVRFIHELQPRFNRQAKTWGKYAYLKLTLNESFPRLSVVRSTRDDGALYLGPLASTGFAARVAEAIESAVPLRRCTTRIGRATPPRDAPCAAAQLGVATCPCAGTVSAGEYAAIVARTVRGLTVDPELLLEPLRQRMEALSRAERFEEAADVRDRAAALAHALRRQRRVDAIRRAGRVVIEIRGAGGAVLDEGCLASTFGDVGVPGDPEGPSALPLQHGPPAVGVGPAGGSPPALPFAGASGAPWATPLPPLPRDKADELACVVSFLETKAHRVRIVHCEHGWSSPLPPLASFEPRERAPLASSRRR